MHCKKSRSPSNWGWYSWVAEVGTSRLIHRLIKQTQFCVSFIALWSQNRSFQTPQSCQIGLCSDPHLWSLILGNDWKSASTRGGDDTYKRFTAWIFAAKRAVGQLLKPWMSSNRSSPNRKISATIIRSRDKDDLWELGEASPAGNTHRKAGQKLTKGQVAWIYLRPCLVPSWCRASTTARFCWKLWGISSPRAASLATLPRGKAGAKMNVWSNFVFFTGPAKKGVFWTHLIFKLPE